MAGRTFAVVLAATALFVPARAHAATRFHPCHGTSGVECGEVVVPLDRTGVTPGTVSLYVERLPAATFPRGVMFLVAGGPGQASAEVFDLAENAKEWRTLFPGYTLVAFDPRGTGRSDPLSCPSVESLTARPTPGEIPSLIARCADEI